MNAEPLSAGQALKKAQIALRAGNRLEARRWAKRAAELAPDREEPWLILAVLGSPRGSIAYLQKALEINPGSQRARKGMHWAVRRLRANPPYKAAVARSRTQSKGPISWDALVMPKPALLPWALVLLLGVIFIAAWNTSPLINIDLQGFPVVSLVLPTAGISQDSDYPVCTDPALQTATTLPSATSSWTPAPTPTETLTLTPTETSTPTLTPTPLPSATQAIPRVRPENVGSDERWIDVDLSQQRTYAYQGDQLLRSFLVSTGTWRHPTVVGQFRIYVKYRYAHMSGPGYYLANVPYVMYFFSGYGLHGTYWHNNFGTPMSHGCVNLRTEDAGWLFNWASVGTIVSVHP